MAGVEGSSDSDLFTVTRQRSRPYRQRNTNNNNPVDALSSTLHDTNRNLRTVDKMLDCYKDYGEQQSSAMDKLREDLARTTERLKTEKVRKARRDASKSPARGQRDISGRRYPTTPLKDYGYDKAASDNEFDGGMPSPSRRRNYKGAVRFHDDMDADESMHEVHQNLRDLHSGQMRLEDDMQRSFNRANEFEYESVKTMKTIADNLKGGSSVERRLQALQNDLSTEKQMLQQNQKHVGTISTHLTQALRDKQKSEKEAEAMKARLSVIESERTVIHKELAKTKHRLDHADVTKSSLQEQVDDLRRALLRSEDGKQKLKEQLQKQEQYLRDRQRKLSDDERDKEYRENEIQRMKDEINDLRHQLNKSACSLGDFGELRKELDRSEKQRQQLSDHIEVLGKDMEERERHSAKMIHQLQTVTEKFNATDKLRTQLEDNLEEAIRKLREVSKQSENAVSALRENQQSLLTSEQKNQELKYKAQETVKQWKAKCKKLEKELHVFRHHAEQATGRSEQLIKELHITKNQSSLTAQQIEHLKREFNTLLAIRAQQEEEVRIKDVQVNELRSFKGDLERDLRDCKSVIERLEHELLVAREKSSNLNEDKNNYEDSMRTMQQSSMLAQSQFAQLQKEVKELNFVRAELAAQLATASSERGELRASLKEARVNEHAARDEIEQLIRRIKDHGESHRVLELTHAQKKQRAEFEAELQAVKLDLQEERASTTLLRRQNDKLKLELDRLNAKLATAEEDFEEAQRKYHKVRGEYLTRTEASEDGLSRAKQIELDLLDQREAFRRASRDHHNVLHNIAAEIDSVVEVATANSIETYKALSFAKNPSEPNSILAEVKAKLAWLKCEIRERRDTGAKLKEAQLTSDILGTAGTSDFDRLYRRDIIPDLGKPEINTYDPPLTYQSRNYDTATSNYLPATTDTYSRDISAIPMSTDIYQREYGTGNYNQGTTSSIPQSTGLYSQGTGANFTGTSIPQSTGIYSQGTGANLTGTTGNYTATYPPNHIYGTSTYPETYDTGRLDSQGIRSTIPELDRYKTPAYGTYDSETYTTPISTDSELQMDDLRVVPERLSRAQVFEAMERMASSGESDKEKLTGSEDSVLRKTQEERDKIHERYSRLQGTLNSLRDELSDTKTEKAKPVESMLNTRDSRSTARDSVSTSPSRRSARRVRISSPPTSEFSPMRGSPSRESSLSRRHRSSSRDRDEDKSRRRSSHSRERSSSSRRERSSERSPSRRSHSTDRERKSSSRERSSSRDRAHKSRDKSSPSRHSSRDRAHKSRDELSPSRHSSREHRSSSSRQRSTSRDRSPTTRHRSHRSSSRDRSPSSRHRSRSDERRTRESGGSHKSRRDEDRSLSHRFERVSPTRISPSCEKVNPLGLTDEEFNAKFLPKEPSNLQQFHTELEK